MPEGTVIKDTVRSRGGPGRPPAPRRPGPTLEAVPTTPGEPADRAPAAPTGALRCTVLPASAAHADGWVVLEQEVRRSRFLACLGRASDEAQAREMVAALRRRHHDARHVCSAFVLGPGRERMRSSDDGEPAGTAGTPMLEALVQRETRPGVADLTDVCAVVVRWFGGVKLGAGGLVRAYSDAVSSALDTAPLVTRERQALAVVTAPHGDVGRWENELRAASVHVAGTDYAGPSAALRLTVPDTPAAWARMQDQLAGITAGSGRAVRVGEEWVDHD